MSRAYDVSAGHDVVQHLLPEGVELGFDGGDLPFHRDSVTFHPVQAPDQIRALQLSMFLNLFLQAVQALLDVVELFDKLLEHGLEGMRFELCLEGVRVELGADLAAEANAKGLDTGGQEAFDEVIDCDVGVSADKYRARDLEVDLSRIGVSDPRAGAGHDAAGVTDLEQPDCFDDRPCLARAGRLASEKHIQTDEKGIRKRGGGGTALTP